MSVLGNRLTMHSPSRGFSMELGSSITVLLASQCRLPRSYECDKLLIFAQMASLSAPPCVLQALQLVSVSFREVVRFVFARAVTRK